MNSSDRAIFCVNPYLAIDPETFLVLGSYPQVIACPSIAVFLSQYFEVVIVRIDGCPGGFCASIVFSLKDFVKDLLANHFRAFRPKHFRVKRIGLTEECPDFKSRFEIKAGIGCAECALHLVFEQVPPLPIVMRSHPLKDCLERWKIVGLASTGYPGRNQQPQDQRSDRENSHRLISPKFGAAFEKNTRACRRPCTRR